MARVRVSGTRVVQIGCSGRELRVWSAHNRVLWDWWASPSEVRGDKGPFKVESFWESWRGQEADIVADILRNFWSTHVD